MSPRRRILLLWNYGSNEPEDSEPEESAPWWNPEENAAWWNPEESAPWNNPDPT